LSLPSFQESFTPEVRKDCTGTSHKRENANLALRGKKKKKMYMAFKEEKDL